MTYIDYINQFWILNERQVFTLAETKVFFFLLNHANRNKWIIPFYLSDSMAIGLVGITINTFKAARQGLVNRQMITFEVLGKGKAHICMYNFTYQKLTPKLTPKDSSTYHPRQLKCQNLTDKLTEKERSKEKEYLNKRQDKDNSLSQCASAPAHEPEKSSVNILPDSPIDIPIPLEDIPLTIRQCEQEWIERFCMNNQITLRDFNISTSLFIIELENRGHKSKSLKDYMAHFASWFSIQKSHHNAKSQTHRPTSRSEQRQQQSQEQHAAILNQVQQLDALYRSQSDSPQTQDDIHDSLSIPPALQPEPTDYPFD